jgi:phosphatidylglycerol:prolipoprotein diacylglycerol transferase
MFYRDSFGRLVAFKIFGTEIYMYALGYVVAFLSCFLIANYLVKKKGAKAYGLPKDIAYDLVIICIIAGILGARVWYVAFGNMSFSQFFNLRDGGLGFYGGLIGVLITFCVYAYFKKISIIKIFDLGVPSLFLGQAIGRWGNFFNQEAYGGLVTNAKWQFFPYAVYIERFNEWHQATFFYESAVCLIGFILTFIWYKKNSKPGLVFPLYLIIYGLARFFIEGVRDAALYIGSIRVSVLTSALLLAGGLLSLGWFIYIYYFKNSKNGENNADVPNNDGKENNSNGENNENDKNNVNDENNESKKDSESKENNEEIKKNADGKDDGIKENKKSGVNTNKKNSEDKV